MRRRYRYSEEEEKQINRELGYTEEQLGKLSSYKQYQVTVSLSGIARAIRRRIKRSCPQCGAKLTWERELIYVGLRHPAGATGGCYEKTYRVSRIRVCPACGFKDECSSIDKREDGFQA